MRLNYCSREEEIEQLAAMTTSLPSPLGALRPTAKGEHNSTWDPRRRRMTSKMPDAHSAGAAAPLSSSPLRSPCPDSGAKTLHPLKSGPARLTARASSHSPVLEHDWPDEGLGLQAIPVFTLTSPLPSHAVAAPRAAARTGKLEAASSPTSRQTKLHPIPLPGRIT